MPYWSLPLLAFAILAPSLRATPPELSADRIKADVAYLASDRLEGRGPGTRGEELATEYLAAEFKKAGLKPLGERGTYFQPVPLVRVVTSPKSTLRATKGKDTLDIAPRRTSPARARRRRSSRSSTPRRSSSATASPRPSSAGTTTRAST